MQREMIGPLRLRAVVAPLGCEAVLALGSVGCTTLPGHPGWDACCTPNSEEPCPKGCGKLPCEG